MFDHGRAASLPRPPTARPLYAELVGPSWAELDPVVRWLHGGDARARGIFRVGLGRSWVARALATCLRLPRAGAAVPVTLIVNATARRETWQRSFAGRWLRTWQWLRRGRLVEATRFWRLVFRVGVAGGGLVFDQVGARFGVGGLAVPLPRCASPSIRGLVEPAGAGARVRIEVLAPLVGLLITYDGVVAPFDPGGP